MSAAAHPGYASTHLQGTSAASSSGGWLGKRVMGALMGAGNALAGQSAEAGALPQLYAATADGVASGDYYGPDGPFEMRGAPKKVGMSGAARDPEAPATLWELSEALTGVTYAW